jgi:hypothetical protein
MIVITTPTGQIGRQVLGNLLDSGEQLRGIALDPSQLPAEVRDDLDIVEGSHGDAAVVDKAFADADAVFWLTPPDPRAPSVDAAFAGFTRPAARAGISYPHSIYRIETRWRRTPADADIDDLRPWVEEPVPRIVGVRLGRLRCCLCSSRSAARSPRLRARPAASAIFLYAGLAFLAPPRVYSNIRTVSAKLSSLCR